MDIFYINRIVKIRNAENRNIMSHWIKIALVIPVRILQGYLTLDKTKEILGSTLQTIHNLYFYQN